jgi:chemotaxis protein methyltransferase CheR
MEAALNSTIPRSPKTRLPREVQAGFSRILAVHLGLHFPPERSLELERGVVLAAGMFGFSDAEKCLAWISASPPGPGKIQILARAFTIGETFFFRDRACFSALEERVLPDRIAVGRARGKRLRIWSAGCCTGEEPYSIAILLYGLLPDWEDWDISILATDINPEFLAKARAGSYNHWSFRNVEDSRKAGCFRATPEGLLEPLPRIKEKVGFAYSNLASAPPDAVSEPGSGFDLILCRNVLMYLTDQCARKAAADFFRLLGEEGWLIVGPTEGASALLSRFEARGFPNAIFYQKPVSRLPNGLPNRFDMDIGAGPRIREESASGFPARCQPAVPPGKPADPPSALTASGEYSALLSAARISGNEGNFVAALEACDQALRLQRLDPALHYLRALFLQEAGSNAEAAKSLERGLYLDPDFVMAHYALGNLALRQGERKKSLRHFQNAIGLLKGLPEDQLLPESDGVGAGRLRGIMGTLAKANAGPEK